ncbi:HAD family hydrolase [Paenibacillus sp. GbtcB18]|uniref:HAD-IIIC family phosphatase n=1 Tax=Paenibacillus sp. GbtcB18 TaxID=2824763 RepID=UPI001C305A68|nr:HAD-IIIC family phosphatase [Paenibacillus sp. GbtcB18]
MADKATKIKCLVWDLDNTLWQGVLLEDANVSLRPGVAEIIRTLDERGILQSVSSKNDHQAAMNKLEEFGLAEYFLYPQINWNAKSESIKQIVQSINIGLNTIAFIDDQPFEREEVAYSLPEVVCLDASLEEVLQLPMMNPDFITEDSRRRRMMYKEDLVRKEAEEEYQGPKEAFLRSLDMSLTISLATEDDLKRAEELTVRTHQLNTTGYTYSYYELNAFRQSDRHKIFILGLTDRYGDYGKIGLVLIECDEKAWTIKLLLMSCRVMSRGVGTAVIHYLINLTLQLNVTLRAEFVHNKVNRMMYISYKFSGFKEIEEDGAKVLFENTLTAEQPIPDYFVLNTPGNHVLLGEGVG